MQRIIVWGLIVLVTLVHTNHPKIKHTKGDKTIERLMQQRETYSQETFYEPRWEDEMDEVYDENRQVGSPMRVENIEQAQTTSGGYRILEAESKNKENKKEVNDIDKETEEKKENIMQLIENAQEEQEDTIIEEENRIKEDTVNRIEEQIEENEDTKKDKVKKEKSDENQKDEGVSKEEQAKDKQEIKSEKNDENQEDEDISKEEQAEKQQEIEEEKSNENQEDEDVGKEEQAENQQEIEEEKSNENQEDEDVSKEGQTENQQEVEEEKSNGNQENEDVSKEGKAEAQQEIEQIGVKDVGERTEGEGWILQADEIIETDLYINKGILDLNGHVLEVKGNLYQTGGMIQVNNGKLIVDEDYCMRGQTENKGGRAKLELKDADEFVWVKGNMQIYSYEYVNYCKLGKFYLEGNLICKAPVEELKFSFKEGSDIEIILIGQKNQRIEMQCREGRLPKIQIKGSEGREIEIKLTTINGRANKMRIYKIINEVSCQLKLEENITIYDLCLNDSLKVVGNCWLGNINLNGKELLVEGDVVLGTRLVCNQGRMFINGTLEAINAGNDDMIKMQYDEDRLEIVGDFKMSQCSGSNLKKGKLIVGGNIIQKDSKDYFCANKEVEVILLGNTEGITKIEGGQLRLWNVTLKKNPSHYQFGNQVMYHVKHNESILDT